MSTVVTEEHFGVVILLVRDTMVLLGERSNSYKAGYFGCPRGRVNLEEPLEAAVKRELQEEVGIYAIQAEYVGVVRELQEATYTFIHFGFIVKEFAGDIQNMEPHKTKEWNWYDYNHLPNNILPAHALIIDMYFKKHLEPVGEII